MNAERRESWLLIFGLAALVAAFVLTVVLPGRRAAQDFERRVRDAEARMAAIPGRLQEVAALQERVAALEATLAEAAAVAPADADADDVLQRVARLAEDSGLVVTRLQPLAAEPRRMHERHPFQMQCTGDWAAVVRFQVGLESGSRAFTVERLALRTGGGETPPGGAIGVELEFSAYSERDDWADATGSDESTGERASDIRNGA